MSTVSTLLSVLKADQTLSKISSANIAGATQEGYVCKQADILPALQTDGLSGVVVSPIYNTIDPILQRQTYKENSTLSRHQSMNELYQSLTLLFGTRASPNTFAHSLGAFSNAVQGIGAHTGPDQKQKIVSSALAWTQQMNKTAHTLQTLRREADQALTDSIATANQCLSQIATLNQSLASHQEGQGDGTTLKNSRDLLIHQLSHFLDVDVVPLADNQVGISLAGSGRLLVQGGYSYELTHTPTPFGQEEAGFSPVSYLGVEITPELTSGRIGGLLWMRDQGLATAQHQLDELSRGVRDQVNALHNQGACLERHQMIGLPSVPGLEGALENETVLSGQGILRIAVLNGAGEIQEYKDIALEPNLSVDALIQSITNAPYVLGGGGNALNNAAFEITQTATGALQIQGPEGMGIALGSVDGHLPPTLCLGDNYNEDTALGFSHFFGLNNFFETGEALASSTPQTSLASQLTLREDLKTHDDFLSIGLLSSAPVLGENNPALANGDTRIMDRLQQTLSTKAFDFLAVEGFAAMSLSPTDYAARIFQDLQSHITQSSKELEVSQNVYTQLASFASEKSGVDMADELMKLYTLSLSQQLVTKALHITLEMEKFLIQTL